MSESRDEPFIAALAELETALETPVVPGELELWANDVVARAEKLCPLLERRCLEDHETTYAEISNEDPALVRRVEQLRKEDRAIIEALHAFELQGRELVEHAKAREPDEASCADGVAKVEIAGLDLVIRIRKQELAIPVWLEESMERERGVQD